MRIAVLSLAMLAGAAPAGAATIIVYTDPMTLARYSVVLATPGPDRAFHCMAPPADAKCTRLALRRGR